MPKISKYDIMNIPSDPGETNIVNIGFGLSFYNVSYTLKQIDFITKSSI
ncbi:MAG: hypothetical protein ISR89_05160 [Candidatus Marinimicrobia bacterium]|nr:hypothetical protein [Candidatus Neomarinimicrobiota bacterium]MBL7030534.1 hypothetical protein [Candidatus Neomarinimicrobiota bacterium]